MIHITSAYVGATLSERERVRSYLIARSGLQGYIIEVNNVTGQTGPVSDSEFAEIIDQVNEKIIKDLLSGKG